MQEKLPYPVRRPDAGAIKIREWTFGFGDKLDPMIGEAVEEALENAFSERPPDITLLRNLDVDIELWALSDTGVPTWRTNLRDALFRDLACRCNRDGSFDDDERESLQSLAVALRALADEIEGKATQSSP